MSEHSPDVWYLTVTLNQKGKKTQLHSFRENLQIVTNIFLKSLLKTNDKNTGYLQ